ncbi:MAG TPA: PPC domain-containing protein [Polyangia bacterium]|nr:PPC domain-containing protein [Polyangia bacterium]
MCILGCSGTDGDGFDMIVVYDPSPNRVGVTLSRPLSSGEAIYQRVRRGRFGQLQCTELVSERTPIANDGSKHLDGPEVDPALLKPFYGPEWAGEPTPDMLAQLAAGTDSIVDTCLVREGAVAKQIELDLFKAWDNGKSAGLAGKADDPSGETMIHSVPEYAKRCVAEMGEIPFFEKTGDGQYKTYNCLDSVPIPMTVTDANGSLTNPDMEAGICDRPQYIYSSCEPGPRVASRSNEQGTHWVLLCRKSIGGFSSSKFNDIAMIGHNPLTGKTCFFQNALYVKTDGEHVPHPGDTNQSQNLWAGLHGGLGSGIECARCHDADPFIHSPWIDQAKDAQGRSVVPKMGEREDFPIGANDSLYSIVNLAGQGWTMPQQLTSPEANACLRCHRIGSGQWLEWASRLDGTDNAFLSKTTPTYQQFRNLHWMPPDLAGLTEATWAQSAFGRALAFIKGCYINRAACQFAPLPRQQPGGGGGGNLRNPVGLPDGELALRALQILGANVASSSNRCNECHSLTRNNLRTWRDLTDTAVATCLNQGGGTPRTDDVASQAINHNQFKTFGPYEVASGGTIRVTMSGSGDADLYLRRNAAPTTDQYDCRPYTSSSQEECVGTGPGSFYVGVNGYAEASQISLHVAYTAPGGGTFDPRHVVDCIRQDPSSSSSPFIPARVGIYAAAAHLGWFESVFQAAFPRSDSWATTYAQFKLRVSMPKGNHPKMTQDELDIVAEWFARELPQLEATLPDDPPPSDCAPSISPALLAHVSQMHTQGWRQVNADRGLLMLGCAGGSPMTCLGGFPRASERPYGAGWEHGAGSTVRILRELGFSTTFWMRSSPDGRFVGNGGGSAGATISDLQQGRDIPVHAAYDPGFFPDNSGFVFQGTSIGAGFCNESLLLSNPPEITFTEPACSAATDVGLYQHLGAGLNGGDYFIINSQFTSDNGGHSATLSDPSADFASNARIKLTPMIQNGTNFVAGSGVEVSTPFEGDSVLSPSTRLVVSRLTGPGARQLGFVVHHVNATPTPSGYSITAPEIGRLCTRGGKPAVSFDERFIVFHHYVEDADSADLGFASPADPGFQVYRQRGAANIILVDLTTGARTRVTTMSAGQYALYPHFRSDGWIHFLVRDTNTGHEYIVASDAALLLGG